MTIKGKLTRVGVILTGSIVAALVLLIAVSCIIYPPEYIFRCITRLEGKTTDYLYFPERKIAKSSVPYHYEYDLDPALDTLNIEYTAKGVLKNTPLDALAESNDTTSLIAIHKDKVIYEKYFNGCNKDSINTSFSTVKSVDSLMIGIAIDEGLIKSEDQQITDFLPELKGTEFADITIKDLLMMRSRIKYRESFSWFGDNAKTYYYPDLRDLALNHMQVDKGYNGQFLYNNYHPLLLGLILERCTGMSVSEYLGKKIWEKVGAENDASWSLDSSKSGFEKMESGLNFKSIDFAKIGSMMLHRGDWNGQRIVSEDWLKRSVVAPAPLEQRIFGYQYMWYSIDNGKGGYDYFASGNHGQYLYVSPETDTVIVRTGTSEGEIDIWIAVFYQMADFAGKSQPDK